MTHPQSPSPIVDEVAGLAAKYRNFEFGHKVMDADDFIDLEADIRRLAASLASPPKAGSGEPVAYTWELRQSYRVSADGSPDWQWAPQLTKWRPPAGEDVLNVTPLYANHEARGDGVRAAKILSDALYGEGNVRPGDSLVDLATAIVALARMASAQIGRKLPPLGDGRAEIDGNDLWEMLFSITKDSVPEGLTDEVLNELAKAINLATGAV